MSDTFVVPDGLEEIHHAIPDAITLIAKTARWVHPETFRALPVWYPEFHRGCQLYNAAWDNTYKNKGQLKSESNVRAAKALMAALGTKKVKNWTVCHVWGYDDPKFIAARSSTVYDRKFYSCVANMIWLPTPLKGFTDALPEIQNMLRTCAFQLYGWVPDHKTEQVEKIKSGYIPDGYPLNIWPTGEHRIHPPGTAPFSEKVIKAIQKRKVELKRLVDRSDLLHFPRDEVKGVLEHWKVELL